MPYLNTNGILIGEEDMATVPSKARRIHEHIAGSRLVQMPRGGHTSSIEEPELVTGAIQDFLKTAGF